MFSSSQTQPKINPFTSSILINLWELLLHFTFLKLHPSFSFYPIPRHPVFVFSISDTHLLQTPITQPPSLETPSPTNLIFISISHQKTTCTHFLLNLSGENPILIFLFELISSLYRQPFFYSHLLHKPF